LLRRRVFLAIIIALAFLCLLGISIYGTVKRPYAGLMAQKKGAEWVVSNVDPNGVGIRDGVRRGDMVLAVNSRPPNDFFNLKWGELEGFQSVEILPASGPPTIISLSGQPFRTSLFTGLPVLLLATAFFILGLIALIRARDKDAAEEIFWLNAIAAAAMAISTLSERSILPAVLLEFTCFGCLSFLLVRLAMVFPVENKTPNAERAFLWSLVISLLVLAFALVAFLAWPSLIQAIRSLLLFNILLGFAFSLAIINISLRLNNYGFVRNQLMLVLMGISIGVVPFLVLTAIPTIVSGSPLVSSEKTSLLIIFIPLTIVYVQSNAYLPSASYLLRQLAINLMIVLPEAAVIGGIIRFGLAYRTLSAYGIFIVVLVVLLVFSYFYARLQERLEEIIFPGHVSYKRKLRQISDSLTGISSLGSLGTMLCEAITRNMSLDGALFLLKKGEGVAALSTTGRYKDNPTEVDFLKQYFLDMRHDSPDYSLPQGWPAAFLISLSKDDYRIGLFLGFELDKAFLSSEELSLLAALGKQVLLAVENIELLGALEQNVKQEQEQARNLRLLHHVFQGKIEDERRAIAREVHDGPLQTAMHVLRLFKGQNAEKERKEINENMEDLIYELRHVCLEMRSPLLDDLGFLPAVQWLVKKLMTEESIEIVMDTKGLDHSVRLDHNVELAAFRLIQEILNNAVKHATADLVQVTIRLNKNLIVKVSDNGQGFDASCSKIDLLKENKFGLIGMEERAQQLGGKLKISSRPVKGTSVVFFIPVAKTRAEGWDQQTS
jgi:two-component system sensor histidine kinase ComP